MPRKPFSAFAAALLCLAATGARASESEDWSLHGQATFVEQYHPAFRSPYRGANSLDPGSRGNETFDTTLFAGARLWDGGEAYGDLEIDQGFGLSNTLGVAGYPSGEAYKVGKTAPYIRLQRLFFRQSVDLGGEMRDIAPGPNQLGSARSADNLVITAGKFSVGDIFDTNIYAHDPKADFLNWSLIDAGAFDYAADAWGYSYGVAAEWTKDWWTLRGGLFDLSRIPNTTELERGFGQYELVTEAEERHALWRRPGKLKFLVFVNRGRMGNYDDAVRLALATGAAPDMAAVRRPATRPGFSVNLEQQVADNLGGFVRASWNDGSKEAFEFTEINRSLSAGLSLKGASWGRPDDAAGVAGVFNALSSAAKRYFAAGGMGILIGDGQLPHYEPEEIAEAYYNFAATGWLTAGADYQLILHPAYSRDRGPVSVLGARLHAQF